MRSRTNSLRWRASFSPSLARLPARARAARSSNSCSRHGVASSHREPRPRAMIRPLDLAGALADLEDLGVAVEAGHGRLLDEAGAAEHLRAAIAVAVTAVSVL